MNALSVVMVTYAGWLLPRFTSADWQWQDGTGRILGGSKVSFGKYPFVVSLQQSGRHYCGGSILNDNSILTAAHCVQGMQASEVKVYIGNVDIKKGGDKYFFKVKKFIGHRGFDESKLAKGNDIGIVKLDSKIDFSKYGSNVAQVCLPDKSAKPAEGKCIVMGWGRNEKNKPQTDLYETNLPIQSKSKCSNDIKNYNDKSLLCAWKKGSASCKGDSGGPLICPHPKDSSVWLQFGLVSFGGKNCSTMASFFTRVTGFLDWIQDKAED